MRNEYCARRRGPIPKLHYSLALSAPAAGYSAIAEVSADTCALYYRHIVSRLRVTRTCSEQNCPQMGADGRRSRLYDPLADN
jgi:hypothetical protein